MKLRVVITSLLLAGSVTAFGGVKEDFMKAVKAAKCEDKVKPTGGRQGNVMKWKTCTADSITLEGCTLSCSDASSKIGG